jgi:hypothetical protein
MNERTTGIEVGWFGPTPPCALYARGVSLLPPSVFSSEMVGTSLIALCC